jgi:hypothetical protein
MRTEIYLGERARVLLVVCLLALAVPVVALRAQPYDLSWWTVDNGGGTSSGGTYLLSGTMGQPDAGHMQGGRYTLDGGFWVFGAAIPPILYIHFTPPSTALLYWTTNDPGWILETKTVLNTVGGWTPVSTNGTVVGANFEVTQSVVVNPASYYRLRK